MIPIPMTIDPLVRSSQDADEHGDPECSIKPAWMEPMTQAERDARDLAEMGHDQALRRNFNSWSMFFFSVSVLATWTTFGLGLSTGLTSGGPVSILWGLALVTVCNLCVAVSLGELCSSMPTALGQAYFVARIWPGKPGRFVSYLCAWISTCGWWTLFASQNAFMTNFLLSMKVLLVEDWPWASTGWVEFLVYLSITIFSSVILCISGRKNSALPLINSFVGISFIALFFIISLSLLISVGIRKDLEFQPASFTFGKWLNTTGWNDGVTWFLGLVQSAYGLTAFDSVVHMTEEIPNPRRNIPRVLLLSVLLGAVTGFIFMVVCLFCIQDLEKVLNPPSGLPFVELMVQAMGLQGGMALLSMFIFNGIGQSITCGLAASRMTWGFARDGGIPWSKYFEAVDDTWHVPVRAIWLQCLVTSLVGTLFIFADTVLEAILSTTTIALTISYGIPIMTLLMVGRDRLPRGSFRLGRFGPVINWIAIVYCTVSSVFFFFPGAPNPSLADMNWAIGVLGVVVLVALGFWVINGHRTYMRVDDGHSQVIMDLKLDRIASALPEVDVKVSKGVSSLSK
ncbi:hypothetical protein V2A60_005903 [Cordyceps javanica]